MEGNSGGKSDNSYYSIARGVATPLSPILMILLASILVNLI